MTPDTGNPDAYTYDANGNITTTFYIFGGAYETTIETGASKSYYRAASPQGDSFAGQTLAMDAGDGLKYFLTERCFGFA